MIATPFGRTLNSKSLDWISEKSRTSLLLVSPLLEHAAATSAIAAKRATNVALGRLNLDMENSPGWLLVRRERVNTGHISIQSTSEN
jgi:hypothetical protein